MLPAHSSARDSAHAQHRLVVAARPRRALHPAGATVADDRFLHRQRRPRRPRPFPRRQRNRTGTDRRRHGVASPCAWRWAAGLATTTAVAASFDLGVALFAVASLLCGLAGSVWLLLVRARPAGRRRGADRAADSRHPACQPQRPRAFPRAGRLRRHRRPGFVVGQVLGGFLVSADIGGLGWRSVFLINLPICLGILLAAAAGYRRPAPSMPPASTRRAPCCSPR